MEGFAALVLGLGMMAAAQDAAYAQYRAGYHYYYPVQAAQADTGRRPVYVYPVAPTPLPAMGAVTGGAIGAAAAGAPGLVVGAMIGGAAGTAASVPPVVQAAPAYYAAPADAPAAPARDPQFTEQYIRHWQGFMQPSRQR